MRHGAGTGGSRGGSPPNASGGGASRGVRDTGRGGGVCGLAGGEGGLTPRQVASRWGTRDRWVAGGRSRSRAGACGIVGPERARRGLPGPAPSTGGSAAAAGGAQLPSEAFLSSEPARSRPPKSRWASGRKTSAPWRPDGSRKLIGEHGAHGPVGGTRGRWPVAPGCRPGHLGAAALWGPACAVHRAGAGQRTWAAGAQARGPPPSPATAAGCGALRPATGRPAPGLTSPASASACARLRPCDSP